MAGMPSPWGWDETTLIAQSGRLASSSYRECGFLNTGGMSSFNCRTIAVLQLAGEGPNRSQYTTYGKIYERLVHYWEIYVHFLSDMKIGRSSSSRVRDDVHQSHPQEAGWSTMADVSKVIPRVGWLDRQGDLLAARLEVSVGMLPSSCRVGNGALTAKMQPALRGEQKKELIIVLIGAKEPRNDKSEQGLRHGLRPPMIGS